MPGGQQLWAAGGISLIFVGLIVVAGLWRWFGNPKTEWTRKLVHFGGGAVCLTLPFVIESHWIVLAMAVGMVAIFTAGRLTGTLKSLHGVERSGRGVEYYPVVIYLLFVLAHDQPWKYVISVLVLATADAAAALIGSRYGKLKYEVDDNYKSVEGSLAFLIVTFVVVLVPLLFWADMYAAIPGALSCVLAALLVAMLVTIFEAVSQGGSDNLWVPLGTLVVLSKILRQDVAEIAMQNVSFLLILAVVSVFSWRSRAFNVGGMLVFTLAAYAAWSLGSFVWALPVLLGLLVYTFAVYAARHEAFLKVRSVFKAIIPPVVVLLAANAAYQFENRPAYNFLYGPFLTGCVAVTIQSCWALLLVQWRPPPAIRWVVVLIATALCTLVLAVPPWLVVEGASLATVDLVFATCAVVAVLFDALMRRVSSNDNRWHLARFVLATAAMLVTALFQALDWSPVWDVW